MFIIQFSPTRCDNTDLLTASVSGDVLTLNGTEFDFGPLNDGDILPSKATGCDYFMGSIERVGDVIAVHLMMPHRANAPEYVTFPDPVTVEDGDVPVPTSIMEYSAND